MHLEIIHNTTSQVAGKAEVEKPLCVGGEKQTAKSVLLLHRGPNTGSSIELYEADISSNLTDAIITNYNTDRFFFI